MPRKKLSEHKSKQLVHAALNLPYKGWAADASSSEPTSDHNTFVVKVDQGIKGRFKKGLVLLDVKKGGITKAIQELQRKGYEHFIIEPQIAHPEDEERYLSMSYDRHGVKLSYTQHGGIHVESHTDTMQHALLNGDTNWQQLADETGFTVTQLQALRDMFTKNYITLLEINPYILTPDGIRILDTAIEIDDAGKFFTDTWSEADIRESSTRQLSNAEKKVAELSTKSPASFKLDVINPDGAVFVLLSGGGASITVADEIYNQGKGELLANYGEYSGNPDTEETYIYTSAVLELLLRSKAPQKVLIIGGAVANFTDIANTFAGIIQAINEEAAALSEQNVKVFVRRGGPRQEIGLAKIEAALQKHDLLGAVHTPKTPLPAVVTEALQEVTS